MSQKVKLSRSSRPTTTLIAETSVVDATTDVSHWRRIFTTILEDASPALSRPHFYLIQANGWQSLCLLAGISEPIQLLTT
jgi:hypothetical protein